MNTIDITVRPRFPNTMIQTLGVWQQRRFDEHRLVTRNLDLYIELKCKFLHRIPMLFAHDFANAWLIIREVQRLVSGIKFSLARF